MIFIREEKGLKIPHGVDDCSLLFIQEKNLRNSTILRR